MNNTYVLRTYNTRYPCTIFRSAFLGAPFLLRDDIPRDSVNLGTKLNGTIVVGCGDRGTCLCGDGIYTYPWRWSGMLELCGTRLCGKARDFTVITGTRDLSGCLRPLCGASDAFTRLTRNVTQFRSLWVAVTARK